MILKTNITLTLILVCTIGYGQTFPATKSALHQLIGGTNIYMIPPESYSSSSNFKGFQNPIDPTSMIMAMELKGPFSEVAKGFTSEMLQTRSMELKNKSAIKIADYDGFLLELDQTANGMEFSKHLLVYGNDSSTTLINATYLKDSTDLGVRMKESILSTFIDSNIKANPREALDYTLNEQMGGLKFHSVVGNGMLFNRDLKTPTESEDGVYLFSDRSYAKVEIPDKKGFCISRLETFPGDFSVQEDKSINVVEIDGLTGYELFATNNEDEKEELYQVILFSEDGGYYIFVGSYIKEFDQALEDIQKVIKTFKRK